MCACVCDGVAQGVMVREAWPQQLLSVQAGKEKQMYAGE